MAFLHGVETIEVSTGSATISAVKTAVIGLVGIAPAGSSNQLIVVASETDAAQFGDELPGFNIPQSLSAIQAQGAGTVIVINVFDKDTMTKAITAEAQTISNRIAVLDNAPIGTVVVLDAEGEASTLVEGTDYSIDAYGNIQALSSSLADGTVLKFSYSTLDSTKISSSDIIGSVDASGQRSGLKLFELAYNKLGYSPKILIAPGYSDQTEVAAELRTLASSFRAVALLDAPGGISVATAIANRGDATTTFGTSDQRAFLLYPRLNRYDEATNSYQPFWFSAFMAGVIAANDNENGYWYSPSNIEINGIKGSEVDITAGISDKNSEANQLNAAGIATVFNSFGTGLRTWGNRNAAYPTNTTPVNFIAIRRVADLIYDSVEQSCLQFQDKPINKAWIDSVKESVNTFINTLIQRGALIDGACTFNSQHNSTDELSAGHVVFDIDFMPPTPAERITFQAYIDSSLLTNLLSN